jgi:hypothetical protein
MWKFVNLFLEQLVNWYVLVFKQAKEMDCLENGEGRKTSRKNRLFLQILLSFHIRVFNICLDKYKHRYKYYNL